MERTNIDVLIDELRGQHYRAGRAFPGERMPHIQNPAVTVALEKENAEGYTLAVTVLYPENMGGGACEDDARTLAGFLRGLGYECVQENCRYDGKSDRFYVRILASRKHAQDAPPYEVLIGGQTMPYITGFSAEQKMEVTLVRTAGQGDTMEAVGFPQLWTLTLEELVTGDVRDEPEIMEPFDVVVRRNRTEECYRGCCWTVHRRQETERGLRRVRECVAVYMEVE